MKPLVAVATVFLLLAGPAIAQIKPSKESLSDLYPGKSYSPYAERSFPTKPLWGDTHLHTALSVDAGLFGCRLDVAEAYRFARGEQVTSTISTLKQSDQTSPNHHRTHQDHALYRA